MLWGVTSSVFITCIHVLDTAVQSTLSEPHVDCVSGGALYGVSQDSAAVVLGNGVTPVEGGERTDQIKLRAQAAYTVVVAFQAATHGPFKAFAVFGDAFAGQAQTVFRAHGRQAPPVLVQLLLELAEMAAGLLVQSGLEFIQPLGLLLELLAGVAQPLVQLAEPASALLDKLAGAEDQSLLESAQPVQEFLPVG